MLMERERLIVHQHQIIHEEFLRYFLKLLLFGYIFNVILFLIDNEKQPVEGQCK